MGHMFRNKTKLFMSNRHVLVFIWQEELSNQLQLSPKILFLETQPNLEWLWKKLFGQTVKLKLIFTGYCN